MDSQGEPLDVERLMREIRADIAARLPEHGQRPHIEPAGSAAGRASFANGAAPAQLSRVGGLSRPITKKARYSLDEFLAYHDDDFIRNAYRALLGREPDIEGASHFLGKIRSGELSRTEVIGRMRYSPEGKSAGVRIDGLLVPFCARTVRRVPVVGPLLGIFQYMWRLPSVVRNHEILESAVFENRGAMRAEVNTIVSEIEQALARLSAAQSEHLAIVTDRIEAAGAESHRLSDRLRALGPRIDAKLDRPVFDKMLAELLGLSGRFDALEVQVGAKADRMLIDKTFGELQATVLSTRERAQQQDAKLADILEQLRELSADIAKSLRELGGLRDANQELGERFAQLLPSVEFAAFVTSTERATDELGRVTRALGNVATDLRSRVGDQLQHEPEVGVLLEEVEALARQTLDVIPRGSARGDAAVMSDGFYARFEDRFRGSRNEIKQRVEVYVPLVRAAGAGSHEAPVLDIGCGRGEWLEVLHEHDLVASGVDINSVAVAGCRARGLEVVEADGIDYLTCLPSASVGAVSAIHVIEHLPFRLLIELFDAAWRVLRPAGVVILETPNPENLVVGACNFYYDPTHGRPLPPEPFRFILESRGFERVEVMRLHPDPQVPDFDSEPSELARLVSERLFGPQDYALIGFKR